MIRLRPSREGDREMLMALWKTVFADEDRYIQTFFRLFFGPDAASVAEEDDRIVSAAYRVPFGDARYIYAVGTHPLWRGRGLGKAVTLAAAGERPAYLNPSDAGLMDWYIRAMGARPVSRRSLPAPPEDLSPIAPAEFAARREAMLAGTPHAAYTPAILALFAVDGAFFTDSLGGLWAMEDGVVREHLPQTPGGEPYILGLNGAEPLYWGLTLE